MIGFVQDLVNRASSEEKFNDRDEIFHRTNIITTYRSKVYVQSQKDVLVEIDTCDGISHTTYLWKKKFTGWKYISLSCLYILKRFEYQKILWKTEDFF